MPIDPGILSEVHPDYTAATATWERNERRFDAGEAAREELDPYQWEARTDDSYTERRDKAVCPPLMRSTAERFVGALFENPAEPDFGEMGAVRPTAERTGTPTQAEVVFDNADGHGADTRGWHAYWMEEMERATATGHRWQFCDAPSARPANLADYVGGRHPYLAGYSPLAVPFWYPDRGPVEFARIVYTERVPTVTGGAFKIEEQKRHLILAKAGAKGFGAEFERGGWWVVGDDGNVVRTSAGADLRGDWRLTGGEVPLWRLTYDARSRGLTDLGSVAVVIMNLLSGLYHDGLTSGGRRKWIAGGDVAAHNEAVGQVADGSKIVTVPASADGVVPTIIDDGAVSANASLTGAIDYHLNLAEQYIMRELTTSPDASGRAQAVRYRQGSSPRLGSMATHLEDAQNNGVRFLQMRSGHANPTGGVSWNKTYDLQDEADRAMEFLALLKEANAQAPEAVADLILRVAERKGLLSDRVRGEDVRAALLASLGAQATRQAQARDAEASFQAELDALSAPVGGDGQ